MGRGAGISKGLNDTAEIRRHILENQRQPDDIGFIPANALEDRVGIGAIGHDGPLVPRTVHGGHEIAQTKIILVLEADEKNLLGPAFGIERRYLYGIG